MVPNFGAPIAMLQNISIYEVFATLAPQMHSKRSILAIYGPIMSTTPQFVVKIGPNLAQCNHYVKSDDAKKRLPWAYNVKETPLPSHKVPRIMRAKAKKAPMCSVSLIAIELKGLAAPGEALKNQGEID